MDEVVRELDLHKIHPNLRIVFEIDAIEELCKSIGVQGQRAPMRIWFDGERLRILDGEKRWRACSRLGISRVKVVIVQPPD